MSAWFAEHYTLLRALHIMAVIAWMAGLMYLPRLYVYHSGAPVGGELDQTLIVMERRLYKGIMNPASVVVWALGLSLIVSRGGMDVLMQPWLLIKLAMVSLITLLHMVYGRWLKRFAAGERPFTHVFYRWINEAPFVLMIVAVVMVVFEPGF